jgi:hypothetical protein
MFASVPAYIHEAMVDAYLKGAPNRTLAADTLRIYSSPWMGKSTPQATLDRIHNGRIG